MVPVLLVLYTGMYINRHIRGIDIGSKIANTDGFEVIYKWRLQQEHEMKASNGRKGMTDEQVAR